MADWQQRPRFERYKNLDADAFRETVCDDMDELENNTAVRLSRMDAKLWWLLTTGVLLLVGLLGALVGKIS